ncbi:hypothetical protein ACJ41O_001324 [Fusarium nematophilum]
MTETSPVKLDAYTINGYTVPDRCEECDASVPDADSRRKHMEETNHRICPLCNSYAPLGDYYGHCLERHAHESWNDHMVSYTDSKNMKEAQPWAIEAKTKRDGK